MCNTTTEGHVLSPFFCADYEDLKGKPFFPGLIKYMASGPVVAMVWQGLDAVKTGRVMLGATNPLASAPGMSYVMLNFRCTC
jgi:nucleoside diphosphate kinase